MTRWGWIIWTVWLAAILGSFIVLESIGWDSGNTLSRYIYEIGRAFPLSIFIAGFITGGLAVHFYWHWLPPGSDSRG